VGASVIATKRVGYIPHNLHGNRRTGLIPEFMQSAGLDVVVSTDRRLTRDWADVVFLQGSMNWYPRALGSIVDMPADERPQLVFWHTEPLPPPSSSATRLPMPTFAELAKIVLRDARATDPRSNARRLRRMRRHGVPDVLATSTASRQAWLAEHGIESHFIPMGYAPSHGRDLGLERDIAALFVGIMTDPRHQRPVRYLRDHGVDVVARGGWSLEEGLWRDERTSLINRAKIFLALQRHPRELSGVRMILGMANRALVMSEPIDYPEPYIPGVHYVSVPLAEMPAAIRYYNEHQAEARRIADEGHRFVTTELTFDKSMTRLLQIAGLL
jgi:hypothetical protein